MAGCPQAMDSAIYAYVCKVKCVSNMLAQYQPDCAVWCCHLGIVQRLRSFRLVLKKRGPEVHACPFDLTCCDNHGTSKHSFLQRGQIA